MPKIHNCFEGQTQYWRIDRDEVVVELYSGQVRKYRLESVTDPRRPTIDAELDEYFREQGVKA